MTGPVAANIPLHPEPGSDPLEVRWVVPAGLLTLIGRPARVPTALAALLAAGPLESVEVEPGAVRTRLRPGHTWRAEGARVRTALQRALTEPGGWLPASADAASDEARLRAAAEQVFAGDVGDFIRSHAGHAEVVGVTGRRVQIALGGSCDGCPARGLTLGLRIERAIRALYPDLEGVDVAS